jgi:uracil permease
MTKVYDPIVIRIAATYAIFLAFIPKISAIIAAVPAAVIGGVSFILYGMISAIGVRNLVENLTDLKKQRNLIIVAIILACGLGMRNGVTFPVGSINISLTGIALAAIVGIVINAVLPGADYEFGENPTADDDNGIAIR